MGWFSAIVIGIFTAVLGCAGAGYVANKCVRWYRISGFEGGAGYYVILIALLGLVAGLVIGIVGARIVSGWDAPGFSKGLGVALGFMSGLVLVSGLLAWLGADLPPEIDGRELEVVIEVRAPNGFTLPVLEDPDRAFASVYLPFRRCCSCRTRSGVSRVVREDRRERRGVLEAEVSFWTMASCESGHSVQRGT